MANETINKSFKFTKNESYETVDKFFKDFQEKSDKNQAEILTEVINFYKNSKNESENNAPNINIDDEYGKINGYLSKIGKEIDSIINKSKDKIAEINDLNQKENENLLYSFNELQKLQEEKDNKIIELNNSVDSLKKELEKEKQENLVNLSKLNEDINNLKEYNKNLKNQLSLFDDFKNQKDSLEKENQILKNKINELKQIEFNYNVQKEKQKLQEEKDNLKNQKIQILKEKNTNLQNEINKLKDILKQKRFKRMQQNQE